MTGRPVPPRKRRVLYNDDGDSIVYYQHLHPMTLAQHFDCVDQLLGTHVDTSVLCVGHATGDLPQDFANLPPRPLLHWKSLSRQLGGNPHLALLRRAREKGLEAIASIRMNDAHFAYSVEGPEKATACRFWLDHPEFRIDPRVDTSRVLRGTEEWKRVLFDYFHPEVQEHVIGYLYNYFNHRPHPHSDEDGRILQEIGDPAVLHRRDQRYALIPPDEGRSPAERWQLPLEVGENSTADFRLGDDAAAAAKQWSLKSVTLRLRFRNLVVEEDVLDLALDGEPMPWARARPVYDDGAYDYHTVEYDLTEGPLPRPGANRLRIALSRRCHARAPPLLLSHLEVITRFR